MTAKRNPWNPTAFFWIGMCSAFLPAYILYTINYRRLDQMKDANIPSNLLAIGACAALLLNFAIIARWGVTSILCTIVNVGLMHHFMDHQRPAYAAHLHRGGQGAPLLGPILMAPICLLTVICISTVISHFYLQRGTIQSFKDASQPHQITVPAYLPLMLEGQYNAAEPLAKAYQSAHPTDGDAYLALAEIYLNTGRLDLAVAELAQLKKFSPHHDGLKEVEEEMQPFIDTPGLYADVTRFNQAIDLIEMRQFAEAETLLNELRATPFEDKEVSLHLAIVYGETGRLAKATEVLETLLKQDPNFDRASEILIEISKKRP